ncbi:hypothetical protein NP493_132g05046 [Ridgeia piscesae]|uniref:PH domain-containing protein n=1 Tax=Ridgeia piscesae TaxID=27915 RepID=A0AAD9P5D7_RIDPI|nr:hypothetical protein NP493_132g05046 [Ridgeia piscesae]
MDKKKGVKSERMMQYVPKRGIFRRAKQKERTIVLTHAQLQCVKDNRHVKVNIHLAEVKAVEELDDIAYAFQVVYIGKDGWNALYLVCFDESQRHDWMKLVTHASKGRGADFDKRYHSGVYEEANGRFTCCNQDRNTPGCQEKTVPKKTVRMKDTVDQTGM